MHLSDMVWLYRCLAQWEYFSSLNNFYLPLRRLEERGVSTLGWLHPSSEGTFCPACYLVLNFTYTILGFAMNRPPKCEMI